ncbi:MAG: hypothetical protein WC510_05530 [Candidatus Omnitrophota bacterium]
MMKQEGMTILEILVSMLIVVLVITGMTNVFFTAKRHVRRTNLKIQAAEMGKVFMDYLPMHIRQDTWDNLTSNALSLTNVSLRYCNSTVNNTAGLPNCPTNLSLNENISFNATYDITSVSGTDLRRVIMNVTWNEH